MDSLEQILATATDLKNFSRWVKTSKIPPKEIERQLLAQPEKIYSTVGLDWLVFNSKSENLAPLLELLLSKQSRPGTLPPWHEVLRARLKNDKRGKLLGTFLRHQWRAENWIINVCRLIHEDQALFKETVDALPLIFCKKEKAIFAVDFVNGLFEPLVFAEGEEREFFTAELARLGTGILIAGRRTQISNDVLAAIQKHTRQLCNLTQSQDLKSRTWVLENLSEGEKITEGKVLVASQGIRYFARAFQESNQGFSAKEILTVLAKNFGFTAIGKKGETVVYSPSLHEDVLSGLIPGKTVLIEEPGWIADEEVIIRAKVKKIEAQYV
jgi:hypothetical protein